MSAILSAEDLNDFITPGVACIKPVEVPQTGEVDIQLDTDGNPLEISKIDGNIAKLAPAQISLADCLACSGCITSAEEILVAQHSHEELIKALREKAENTSEKVFVASISHQARASLAAAYRLPVEALDRLLVHLFTAQMGFSYVVGTSVGRKLSLIAEAQNVISQKEAGQLEGPVLSSICPGWVLYAEKTHPYVLSKFSTVKLPQQITGCLLKNVVSRELRVQSNKIYHLLIMPCFDKKLESARPEKNEDEKSDAQNMENNDKTTVPDVDCVLTPKELVTLLDQHSETFQLVPKNFQEVLSLEPSLGALYAKAAPQSWPSPSLSWANDDGSASGGYGLNYLTNYQMHLVLKDPKSYQKENFSIKPVAGKNSDIYELRLLYNNEKIASTAVVNGFRNIQNLVRKFKPSQKGVKINLLVARRRGRVSPKAAPDEVADASKCDYVEVMACPSGCINGGGQIAPPTEIGEKEWISHVTEKYREIGLAALDEGLISEMQAFVSAFCAQFGVSELRLLHTWFHEVEKMVLDPTDPATLLGAKW